MAQKGQEPNPDNIPIEYEDLALDCQIAVAIYNSLGNRIYPDIGFVGKDYTILPSLLDYYGIKDLPFLLDMLNILDADTIDKSQRSIKKAVEDMKSTR